MKKRLAVIGAGTAGLVSAGLFCTVLDNTWDIVSIHNPNVDSLGIGESTNGNFLRTIEEGMNFTFNGNGDELDATKKFGTRFINWREGYFDNPLIQGSVAVHFNTKKFKEYTFKKLPEIWPEKYSIIEGEVNDIQQNAEHAVVTVDHEQHVFDFVIDCRGFPTDYSDYTLSNCSLVNHSLVYDSPVFNPVEFTEHHATKNGWMFGVPLKTRCGYGYMYNDTITTKEDALADMADLLNVPQDKLDVREYTFKPYYANKFLDGRVLKNGNRALFFEPISATSIYMYIRICEAFLKVLVGKYTELDLNQSIRNDLEDLETVIRWYYHNGSIHNTEFWKQAQARAVDQLKGDWKFYRLVNQYKTLVKEGRPFDDDGMVFNASNWHILDKLFGCEYFTGKKEFNFDLDRVSKHEEFLIKRVQTELKEVTTKDQDLFKKNGYVVLPKVIDELTVDLVTHYALNDNLQNFSPESEEAQIPGTHSIYADPLMESLIAQLLPVMQKATGLELYPTYSYYRVYKPGDILKPHVDRDSCEISTSVCFNFDYREMNGVYQWPIFMAGKELIMQPGDVVVYKGCDIPHWREEFAVPEGSWHVQAFFHYVDANGKRAEWKWDKRPGLGYPKESSLRVIAAEKDGQTLVANNSPTSKNYIMYTK
jgi:hypothetical protein